MGYQNIIVQDLQTKSSDIDAMSFKEFLSKEPKTKRIPNYQRPYSWDESQVNVLFKDLDNVIKVEGKQWFFGPLFTTRSTNEKNIVEVEILDGQQRITTIILMLRVLYCIEHYIDSEWAWSDKFNDDDRKRFKDNHNGLKGIIKSCLIEGEMVNDTFQYKSRFLTDLSSREVFSEWIENMDRVKDKKSYKSNSALRNMRSSKFALTKERINKNLVVIQDRIEKRASDLDGLVKINELINCILNRLYIINVPLYKSSSVLEIFETLNNRGKPLNLTDLLRFRSLVDTTDEGDKNRIEIMWHEIFEVHQNLEKVGLFKGGMNDFFEKYINSISDKSGGFTKDQDRLDYFVSFYKEEGGSLKELQRTLNVLHLFQWFFTKDTSGKNRVVRHFKGADKTRVSALLKVLHYALISSETSLITMCSYFRNKIDIELFEGNSGEAQRNVTMSFVFEFIKFIISLDIYQRKPSNERRNIYISKAIAYRKGNEAPVNIYVDLKKFEKLDTFKASFFQNLVLIKHDNRNEKYNLLVLHFIQLLISCKNFDFPGDYVHNDDHIVPQKWHSQKEWIEQVTEKSLIEAIKSIDRDFIRLAFEELLVEELWNDTSSKSSFVQLIGNKWYIHYKENIKASNLPWKEHKDKKGNLRDGKKSVIKKYKETPNAYFFIPTIEDPLVHDNFNAASIINRTVKFFDVISENIDISWNSLKVD